jgi:diaminohydroxyphosphoribosylaminopyrimidine deaminase / 5-amino-6-(5-phosphoribosylamino)uracil reductase
MASFPDGASERDFELVRRSLELARRGIGLVSPNPLVGCVITNDAGEIVGEGAYIYDDIVHAEVIALQQAGERARGGTAYVSLEPHDHHNRTRPCTDALIEAGIKRVVCPIEDPNPLVSGRGFERLRSTGIELVTGLLAEEAATLNEKFICWHRRRRPFVHLKLATSLDGRISSGQSVSTALSSDAALKRVHELRHEYDAILIGSNTAVVDDPLLTDRSGRARRRPLLRVVLDSRLRLYGESRLVQTAREEPLLVLTTSRDVNKIDRLRGYGVEIAWCDTRDLSSVLGVLRERQIQSVLVEGGTNVAGAFCDARLVDKVTFIAAPVVVGGGEAPMAIGGQGPAENGPLRIARTTVDRWGDDVEITGYPTDVM